MLIPDPKTKKIYVKKCTEKKLHKNRYFRNLTLFVDETVLRNYLFFSKFSLKFSFVQNMNFENTGIDYKIRGIYPEYYKSLRILIIIQ